MIANCDCEVYYWSLLHSQTYFTKAKEWHWVVHRNGTICSDCSDWGCFVTLKIRHSNGQVRDLVIASNDKFKHCSINQALPRGASVNTVNMTVLCCSQATTDCVDCSWHDSTCTVVKVANFDVFQHARLSNSILKRLCKWHNMKVRRNRLNI